MKSRIETVERKLVYDGFWRVERCLLRHGLFAGGMSEPLSRELAHRGHSVGVLPYDPETDHVVLVEQFRVGALDDPRDPWLMETVAGMVKQGESPEQVARREAQEEAGCALGEMLSISHYYPSPGGCSEETTVFCGKTSVQGVEGVHGNTEEGEDILVHVVELDEALTMIETGAIRAAMPIIALQWLALNRDRVRDLWT